MRNSILALALLICFTVPGIAADLSGVSGVYINQRDNTQVLTLRSDATFVLKQRKPEPDPNDPFIEFAGKYMLNGETLTLMIDNGGKAEGQLKGNVFIDSAVGAPEGDKWVKKSEDPKNVVRPKYKRIF